MAGGERLTVRARTRLGISAAAGAAVSAGAAGFAPWQVTVLAGWDVVAAVFLVWLWAAALRLDADGTRTHATRDDPSRFTADLLLLSASVACLAGVGFTLLKASSAKGGAEAGLVAIAVASVVLSWSVVHSIFTLRYARLYYGDRPGGIDFNEDEPPAYRDFAYLAFTIGMTYQVSDTNLQTKSIRSTALRHGLLSYLFGTVIVAMTINVVAGLLK